MDYLRKKFCAFFQNAAQAEEMQGNSSSLQKMCRNLVCATRLLGNTYGS